MKILLVLVVALLLSSSALAYKTRFEHGQSCPDLKREVTWHDYISGITTPKRGYKINPYGVEFRYARGVADAELGAVLVKQCYIGYYRPTSNGRKLPAGFMSYPTDTGPKTAKMGLPGDPLNYEINVHGTIFIYTDEGFIYDRRGRQVAMLVCYYSDECDRF
jgi:hypothetical protein